MATISNVRLSIDSAGKRSSRVTVTYVVCFTACEAMAGSVFRETIVLRGDDPIWDDHLLTLRSACVKATQGCVERSASATVSNDVLDEDPDTIIFGWVIGNKDEIYARVEMVPFVPAGSGGNSNTVTAHFGPAGH